MYTGGDITEINWNHPVLGSGTVFIKASEDNTYNMGGVRANDDMNGVAGNGEAIDQLNRQRWSVECTVAWDMNVNLDLEKLSALAGHPIPASWTVSHINGSIHGAVGRPVGDLAGNGNTATFPLKLSGGGVLKKI